MLKWKGRVEEKDEKRSYEVQREGCWKREKGRET